MGTFNKTGWVGQAALPHACPEQLCEIPRNLRCGGLRLCLSTSAPSDYSQCRSERGCYSPQTCHTCHYSGVSRSLSHCKMGCQHRDPRKEACASTARPQENSCASFTKLHGSLSPAQQTQSQVPAQSLGKSLNLSVPSFPHP